MKKIFVLSSLLLLLVSCKKYAANEGAFRDDFVFTLQDTLGARADGVTFITLRLTNALELKDNLKVIFSSNKGTILQPEQPYLNNMAETGLLLADDTGRYLIKATLKEGETVKLEKSISASFQQAYISSQYSLEVFDSAGVRANGNAMISIRMQASALPNKQNLVAHFETNKGVLLQSDVAFVGGMALTRLTVSQDTGTYVLKGQIKDGATIKIEKSVLFNLRRANPHTINVELNSSTWTVNQTIIIKTLLMRTDGKVTIGQPAWFQAFQIGTTGNTNVGRFEGLLNNVSNASGQLGDVKLILDSPNLDAAKPVNVQVKALNDAADTIRVTVMLAHI